jgi:hypothetical protein
MKTLTLNLFILFLLFTGFTQAQEPSDTTKKEKVIVTTSDGKQRVGVVISDDGRELLLLTEDIGKIYIRKDQISSIKQFDQVQVEIINDQYSTVGPFTTRYYFTTNALPIKKNEDYAMIHLYGPEVHFSLSNRFSIGIMTSWIASPFIVAAKYTIPTKNENVNFGIGTMLGSSGYLNTFRGYGGLHWGMLTLGNRFNNLTISAGFSYVQAGNQSNEPVPGFYYAGPSEYYPTLKYETVNGAFMTAPAFGIGGIAKVGKKASFIFDSMVFFYNLDGESREYSDTYNPITGITETVHVKAVDSDSEGTVFFLMPGMRFQGGENNAFQVALAGVTRIKNGDVNAFPIPMCSWFFKF